MVYKFTTTTLVKLAIIILYRSFVYRKLIEPRVPEEREEISSLNVHVFDSVDKIYLYKKSDTFVMMPLRKRGASQLPIRQMHYIIACMTAFFEQLHLISQNETLKPKKITFTRIVPLVPGIAEK